MNHIEQTKKDLHALWLQFLGNLDQMNPGLLDKCPCSVAIDSELNSYLSVEASEPGASKIFETVVKEWLPLFDASYFTVQLPSGSLYPQETGDLQNLWFSMRRHSFLAALCFLTSSMLEDDPLEQAKRQKIITAWEYNHAWATADFWRRLWELIQVAQKYLRTDIQNYPFKSARDFFCYLIQSEKDQAFLLRKQNHHWVQSKEWQTRWQNLRNGISPSDTEPGSEGVQALLLVSEIRSQKDKRLKQKLEDFHSQVERYAEFMIELAQARTAKGMVFKSELWISGERHVAGKRGVFP